MCTLLITSIALVSLIQPLYVACHVHLVHRRRITQNNVGSVLSFASHLMLDYVIWAVTIYPQYVIM